MSPYKNNEELFFSYYLDEMKELGLIESYKYEPETFELSPEVTFDYIKNTQLKTKIKIEEKTKALLHKHCYTPDFKILPGLKGTDLNIFSENYSTFPIFIMKLEDESGCFLTYIDIKGQHAGKLSTAVTFPLNQKWMFSKHEIYVQKIKPFDLFKQTFTPKLVIEEMKYKRDYWKKGKILAKQGDNRLGYDPITIEQWIKSYDK